MKTIRTVLYIILGLLVLFLGICLGAYLWLSRDLPSLEVIMTYKPPETTKIFDVKNRLVGEFFEQKREVVPIEDIPLSLQHAYIAIEDRDFYKHWGINMRRVLAAIYENIIHGRVVMGASTITQQLARNMFLTPERSITRKLKEALLAIRIERAFTKDEILERYLNQLYFGHGVYGVATASKFFFNKPVKDLDVVEAALIAAISRSPQLYSPLINKEAALRRRNIVLEVMAQCGYLDSTLLDSLKQVPIRITPPKPKPKIGQYYLEEVRKYLEFKYGYDFLYRSGASVYIAMDLDIQQRAESILDSALIELENEHKFEITRAIVDTLPYQEKSPDYIQGAIVVIDNKTGEVRALVGGRDFTRSKFNRAVQAKRQAGSAFKPFLLAAALDNGFTPADLVFDAPIRIHIPGTDTIYKPSNYDRRFLGTITLRKAIALSRNLVAVRLIRNIGPEVVMNYAYRMGIRSRLKPVISLGLGACEVSLLEMTAAYTTLANLGVKVNPILIKKIVDRDGNVLERNEPYGERVLSPQTAYVAVSTMKAVVDGGTGYRIRKVGFNSPAAGKTGTTDNYTDAWFIGFTPQFTTGIWIGFDQPRRIFRGATGGRVAAPIWGRLMKLIVKDKRDFDIPPGVVSRKICLLTGLLATRQCPKVREIYFIEGTEPKDSCNYHTFRLKKRDEFQNLDRELLNKLNSSSLPPR
ncbi:hypothetical protein DRP53_07580 [candidate division WOR-3 bacterium]|uniref:Uncharacterized protein n=1 Tax=candidate division WOR-3 bacterium TaxID=2052148 RepID=A0A660SG82_UNCW3|nr:MAG: hypothetical protein DRP53_07580 [candidate division WOR-3 bacterium]